MPRLRLFGKLYVIIALASLVLIWMVMLLSQMAERQFSLIAEQHKAQLNRYAIEASGFVKNADRVGLESWLQTVRQKENTWLAVTKTDTQWLAGAYDDEVFYGTKDLTTGRSIDYPIHIQFDYNPVMRLPLGIEGYNLLIRLPQHMRPGAHWQTFNNLITLGLPILLVALLSAVIYRHIISPLRLLQDATQRVADGDYSARIGDALGNRADELAELANSFDSMSDRIGKLLKTQRQLIQDISHELRTPITRIRLVFSEPDKIVAMGRIEQEVDAMQSLVEDTLTLSWLETEKPALNTEAVDLSLLLDTIAEDARFEFPDHTLTVDIPDSCLLSNSSHRALGQALENMIRNALKYSPVDSEVRVSLQSNAHSMQLRIRDHGPGVAEHQLKTIFKPFFRVDPARSQASGGFGLGLALAQRQIHAIGGDVYAENCQPSGLCLVITLPRNSVINCV